MSEPHISDVSMAEFAGSILDPNWVSKSLTVILCHFCYHERMKEQVVMKEGTSYHERMKEQVRKKLERKR